ncbi:hypothetical protein ACET3Z_014473 [Daucus carota]
MSTKICKAATFFMVYACANPLFIRYVKIVSIFWKLSQIWSSQSMTRAAAIAMTFMDAAAIHPPLSKAPLL